MIQKKLEMTEKKYITATWYKKVLTENRKEVIRAALISLVVTTAFSLWYFIIGEGFKWTEYRFISEPTLSFRFLSALVFASLGEILYDLGFYYVLHFVFVVILRDRAVYNQIKRVIWLSLMAIVGFIIVPWIIDLLNAIISFFYNIFNLILYLFPPLGVSLIVFSIGYIIFKKCYALPRSH